MGGGMADRPDAGFSGIQQRLTIRSEATEVLRRSIVLGDLVPGALYSVAQLAELLGVSRTPVREALLELASRGMVTFVRNRGVTVVPFSADVFRDMFEVRLLLEVPATQRAVELMSTETVDALDRILHLEAQPDNDKYARQELDRAFHRTLLLQSGNRVLVDTVDRLRDMVLVRQVPSDGAAGTRDFAADHRAIVRRVRDRDADGAAALVKAHIEGAAAAVGVDLGLVATVTKGEQ
jgi:DNA-binding GntR family transcriptional regulator